MKQFTENSESFAQNLSMDAYPGARFVLAPWVISGDTVSRVQYVPPRVHDEVRQDAMCHIPAWRCSKTSQWIFTYCGVNVSNLRPQGHLEKLTANASSISHVLKALCGGLDRLEHKIDNNASQVQAELNDGVHSRLVHVYHPKFTLDSQQTPLAEPTD